VWPVLPGSEKPPRDWAGWPEGKQFALVLTHDIEGPSGLAKCHGLMDREIKLGFRSSYNFVPEGSYSVPETLRSELTANGFEVGVHDLHHDGKLFKSRRSFQAKKDRINHHLQRWGAVGFRSGFMLHNLEWIKELNILYDASTFDTDPFEPQPDGVGTIFPFWVSRDARTGSTVNGVESECGAVPDPLRPSHRGYVELPYTLCQDSTLFLLLREQTPSIWIDKMEWIAKHGGMVLLNTHPDYMNLGGDDTGGWRYDVQLYEYFLEHVRAKFGTRCWNVTPRELAAWYKGTVRPNQSSGKINGHSLAKASTSARKRVCMVTYSVYEHDNRVSRYARELAKRGDAVDVFSLKMTPDQSQHDYIDGVSVHRLLYRSRAGQKTLSDFLLPVLRFLLQSSARIAWRHVQSRYDFVHVHNVPDFLVLAALLPRLTGSKVILDIHDMLPEFYASKFNLPPDSFGVRLLKTAELCSARLAHHVILSNHLWRDKYASRTGKREQCSCFINNVDTDLFGQHPRTRNDGKLIVLYPGGLQWHQGLDIAIRAFKKVSAELPHAEFHIYGDGNVKDDLVTLSRECGLGDKVRFFDSLPARQIVQLIANADLGVVPKRADSFGNEAYSTKIMEFMSQGVPMVVSRTKIDRFYFDDSVVRFFKSGDSDEMADAMLAVLRDPELRDRQVKSALRYVSINSWDSRKAAYLELVDGLLMPNPVLLVGRTDPLEKGCDYQSGPVEQKAETEDVHS
jgi:glycosyltransferase involved in cell wall biosynthesis